MSDRYPPGADPAQWREEEQLYAEYMRQTGQTGGLRNEAAYHAWVTDPSHRERARQGLAPRTSALERRAGP